MRRRRWTRDDRLCCWLRQWFLPLGVAALLLGIYSGANAQTTPTSSPSSWQTLKETLNEALDESRSLEKRLATLQDDNERLLSLSNQQGESLQELSRAHADLQSSLEQLSRSLTTSNEQAEYLERVNRRNRLVWQIGIPAAALVGVLGGVWVAN